MSVGNNYQFTNEDSVNNIVDVVLGITNGDINSLENTGNPERKQTQNTSNSSSMEVKENNKLLKDLIKILTIKELQSKQNVRRFPYTYGNGNPPYYMQNLPYMVN